MKHPLYILQDFSYIQVSVLIHANVFVLDTDTTTDTAQLSNRPFNRTTCGRVGGYIKRKRCQRVRELTTGWDHQKGWRPRRYLRTLGRRVGTAMFMLTLIITDFFVHIGYLQIERIYLWT